VIVDSSAIIALVLREPGWEDLVDKIAAAPSCAIGAPTLAETAIVLTAKIGPTVRVTLGRLLHEAGIVVIPFAEEHWSAAVEAYARFGKGRHPAKLNFGDCLTYAIARLSGQSLLFVGNDFTKTDVTAALP